ncbi:MAG: transketolase [Anaerolineaceae bacterium]|nr:transketolase [Anaerolineaceae bacterium]
MKQNRTDQERAINTLRFLSVDIVQAIGEGHPGLPMGCASILYTLYTRHLRHNPKNPNWFNRDRFVLSGGHGSTLLYSMLHLTGYDLPLEEIKKYHVFGSKAPGHPEYGHTAGVDATTGPLGQGFANAVGMALAEAHLAAEFNRPGHKIIDHYTYALVTDGDLMEGVASEAASLAGNMGLGKLIFLYDDNKVCIEGSTDLTFNEDRGKRFEAYNWHVQYVNDGNDVEALDTAILAAKQDPRPSIILCRTHLGYGFPTLQDNCVVHGAPPGWDELNAAKRNMAWPLEPLYYIPEDSLTFFRKALSEGEGAQRAWQISLDVYKNEFPELANELMRRIEGTLPEDWQTNLPEFPADCKGLAARNASGKVLNAIAKKLPELFGGSADLAPSNKSWLEGCEAFSSENPQGRNLHFGIREHAMAAMINGIAYHKGLLPYGATYLVFTDYMRGAMRLSSLAKLHVIFLTTHDSIYVGGDGPTHQPVEQLAGLRALPGLSVIRPADANEVREAWIQAIRNHSGPTLLALSRQDLPTLDRRLVGPAAMLQKGAYVLRDFGHKTPELILMGSGSEVHLILQAAEQLSAEGISVRSVSFPSFDLFEKQDASYKEGVFPSNIRKRIAVEAGVSFGWERYTGLDGLTIGVNTFGSSASAKDLVRQFGLTIENIVAEAKTLLARK